MSAGVLMDPTKAVEMVLSKANRPTSDRVCELVEKMRPGITFGAEWPTEFFEESLGLQRDVAAFGMAMSEVNALIERDGFHITSRGKHGNSYFVESVERAPGIIDAMSRKAKRLLVRSAVFAHASLSKHGEVMTESQRRRVTKQMERQSLRAVLVDRVR